MIQILKNALFFTIYGWSLAAVAIRAQISNPTYALLNLEAYRAYYPFYVLGPKLDDFTRLGVLAAVLVLTSWPIWASRRVGIDRYISYSRHGESFSLAWRVNMVAALTVLGAVSQVGWLFAMGADLFGHRPALFHLVLLMLLTLAPAMCALLLDRKVVEHRLLFWPLGLLTISGLALSFCLLDVAAQVGARDFLIPPMVSTHYGPWGILGWVTGLGTLLGISVGLMLFGLIPAPEAEPDSPHPVPRHRLGLALALSGFLGATLLATYPLYLVPRFQIGQDLKSVLALKQGVVAGRTVVFLDSHSPPHTLTSFSSWSTPENLAKVRQWIVSAPSPSALTRPAAEGLGDEALWQWRPEDALDWVEVQRRRVRFSNLNRVFLQVLESAKPSVAYAAHLQALLDPQRFAWPGPGSRLELAALLRRYGESDAATRWESGARELGGDDLPPLAIRVPSGSLKGQLLLDGKPLRGARVALFHGSSQEELLRRSDDHIEGEQELMQREWRPTYYQYLDLVKLQNFYAVETTDAEGRFLFESADAGLYRLAVRLDNQASLPKAAELPRLGEGEERDLGTFELTSEN